MQLAACDDVPVLEPVQPDAAKQNMHTNMLITYDAGSTLILQHSQGYRDLVLVTRYVTRQS